MYVMVLRSLAKLQMPDLKRAVFVGSNLGQASASENCNDSTVVADVANAFLVRVSDFSHGHSSFLR